MFIYDINGLLIEETDGSGNALRDYVYLNGEPAAMKVYGDTDAWYWFLNDHLGTPQVLVNAAGLVVWEAGYLPFGEARIVTAGIENNLRFPGQYYDAETGLHYNFHRYYNPATGRYITADPIGLEGGINLYAYVNGNPVNAFDFYGLVTPGAGTIQNKIESYVENKDIQGLRDFIELLEAMEDTAKAVQALEALKNLEESDDNAPCEKENYRKKTKGANKKDKQQISDAAREKGITGEKRKKFGKFVEKEKKAQGRSSSDNFTYDELLDLADEFLE